MTTISAPGGVIAGKNAWRIWGTGTLRVGQVFTVPNADCGTLVGYTTTGPVAHVARLDAHDALLATYELGAFELRGLAAEPDGHFGALLWDQTVSPAQLHLTRFDATGANPRVSPLPDVLAAPTDFNIGESRLEYGGGRYGAYFHVHGVSGFAAGHEGDQLKWIDAASGAVSNGWSWGCSHSMSELLRFGGGKFLAACVTDCYPGTSGSNFATDSIGGVYLDNARKVVSVDGGCNGSVAGELGGLAPAAAGWKLVFNAHQNAATNGQSSYNTASMNQDIGFASIDAAGAPMGGVTWLTTTPGNEANAAISAWHPQGDAAEQYVVGWTEVGGATRTTRLGRFTGGGAVIEAPLDVTATATWGERDDPFREHTNHDLVWAWFDAAGATSFHFARLASGATAQCP